MSDTPPSFDHFAKKLVVTSAASIFVSSGLQTLLTNLVGSWLSSFAWVGSVAQILVGSVALWWVTHRNGQNKQPAQAKEGKNGV